MRSMARMAAAGTVVVAAVLLGGCSNDVTDKNVTDAEITLADLQKLYGKKSGSSLLLIDTEMPQTYAEKHIAGAVNMPWTTFSEKRDDTDPRITAYDNIVIYGRNRSTYGTVYAAGKRMIVNGYSIEAYLGGLEEWERAGLPVEKGKGTGKVAEQRKTLK